MEKWKYRERKIAIELRRLYDGEGEWAYDHAGEDTTHDIFSSTTRNCVDTRETNYSRDSVTTMEKPCNRDGAIVHLGQCPIARLTLGKDESKSHKGTEEVYPILRVGNLVEDTLSSDLIYVFDKQMALECEMCARRNFALLYFKCAGDTKTAKDALQGLLVRENSIRIEFARQKTLFGASRGP